MSILQTSIPEIVVNISIIVNRGKVVLPKYVPPLLTTDIYHRSDILCPKVCFALQNRV